MVDAILYKYEFPNGIIKLEKRYRTKTQYEWFISVDLFPDEDGSKRYIVLDQRMFLTKNWALKTTKKLLSKYKLL